MRLVERHLGLCRAQAWKLANHIDPGLRPAFDVDDMIQAGAEGLIDAARKFHGDVKYFPGYANWRIKGAIIDAIRQARIGGRHYWQKVFVEYAAETPHEYGVETNYDQLEARDMLRRLHHVLTARERLIVFAVMSDTSHRRIADELGVSESRVSQIYQAAIRKMRREEHHARRRLH